MKRILLFVLLAVLFVGAVISFSPGLVNLGQGDEGPKQTADAKKPYVLAVVGPMSGTDKPKGMAMLDAAKLYVEQHNAKRLPEDRPLEILVYDDRNKADLAKTRAEEIAKYSPAHVVLGHRSSPASIAAGPIYETMGIPVITGTATAPGVTKDNGWYFRNVADNNLQASFMAHYANKVLRHNIASIITKEGSYGTSLAVSFADTALKLGMSLKKEWAFGGNKANQAKRLTEIITDLDLQDDPGIIFLAMRDTDAVKVIKRIRDAGIKAPLFGPASLGKQSFPKKFSKLRKEQEQPGFYTDGLYVTSSLIFDIAGQRAQDFRVQFRKRFGYEPDAASVAYYDAAAIAVQAITHTDDNNPDLKAHRKEIRNYLTAMNAPERGYDGLAGLVHFDQNGNVVQSVPIGVFADRRLVSAPVQLQPVTDISRFKNIQNAVDDGVLVPFAGQYMYRTNIVYTGVDIKSIGDIDFKKLTYTADMLVWFRFEGDLDMNQIEFLNAVEPIKLGKPVTEKFLDATTYRAYRIKGRFKADFIPSRFVFGQHILGVSFRHKALTRNNLIFVSDVLGMNLRTSGSLAGQLKRSRIFGPKFDWSIGQAWIYPDTLDQRILGDPDHLKSSGGVVGFSRFNLGIQIKRNEFTFSGLIPLRYLHFAVFIGAFASLLLAGFANHQLMRRFSKPVWLLQAVFIFVLLVAAEDATLNYLTDKGVDVYYLNQTALWFEIAWYAVGAILLNTAVERFMWVPLELKTGRAVPNSLRIFVMVIIYMLALFAAIAFVFDQRITSLLATSGVLAMIIGLAVQMNISNIFSGIAINVESPFRIGDWIKVGGYDEGKVVDVTWRTTRLLTRDRCILSIPNSVVSDSAVHNFSYPDDMCEFWFRVKVDPEHKPAHIIKILRDAVLSSELIEKDPAPAVRYRGLSENGAEYSISYYIRDYGKKIAMYETVWTRVWHHLNRAGVSPAMPRRELYNYDGQPSRGAIEAKRETTVINEVDIFSGLSTEQKAQLAGVMKRIEAPAGEIIVRQDDTGDSLFLIAEGVVSVSVRIKETNETLELTRLGAGDFFGEMALLSGEPRTTTIVAHTDSELFEITKDDFEPFVQSNEEFQEVLNKYMVLRKEDTKGKITGRTDKDNEKDTFSKRLLRRVGMLVSSRGPQALPLPGTNAKPPEKR
ncbi:MAG: mechanosensitive ion channel [Rhodospirillales bacterium]